MHIDRNPHPDARIAFDYVKEAYDTLSDPQLRKIYDKRVYMKKKWSYKKIRQFVIDFYQNSVARWKLTLHRLTHGQINEEMNEAFLDPLKVQRRKLHNWLEKVVLVPESADRFALINQVYRKYRGSIFGICFLLQTSYMILTKSF